MDIVRGVRNKVEFTEDLIRKVADLAAQNNSAMDISKQIKLSYPIIRKIMRQPEYQSEIKSALKERISRLAGLMAKVLEDKLTEGDLDAVKLGLKVLGVVDAEDKGSAKVDAGITVILPNSGNIGGVNLPKQVENEVIDVPKEE